MNEMTKARIKIAIAAFVFLYCSFKLLQTVYTWTWTPVEAVVLDVEYSDANNGVRFTYQVNGKTFNSTNVNLFGWLPGNKLFNPLAEYEANYTKTAYVNPIFPSSAVLERDVPLSAIVAAFVALLISRKALPLARFKSVNEIGSIICPPVQSFQA